MPHRRHKIALLILCCSFAAAIIFMLADRMPASNAEATETKRSYEIAPINEGRLYVIFTGNIGNDGNTKDLTAGLKSLDESGWTIVKTEPMTSRYGWTDATSALLVYVEPKSLKQSGKDQ